MGPSGSGKITLLNLIAGIDKPDVRPHHGGRDRHRRVGEGELAAWRAGNVGFIFQFYNLMPVLTAYRKRGTAASADPLSRRERREHVETVLRCSSGWPTGWTITPRAFRRPAAAGRHRAGRRDRPGDPGGGRADRRSGPRLRRGDSRLWTGWWRTSARPSSWSPTIRKRPRKRTA